MLMFLYIFKIVSPLGTGNHLLCYVNSLANFFVVEKYYINILNYNIPGVCCLIYFMWLTFIYFFALWHFCSTP